MKIRLNTIFIAVVCLLLHSTEIFSQHTNVYRKSSTPSRANTKAKSSVKESPQGIKKVKPQKAPSDDLLSFDLKNPAPIEVYEIFESISVGQRPGLKVPVAGGDLMTVEYNWMRYLKHLKAKNRTIGGDLVSLGVFVNGIETPVDLYARLQNYPEGVFLKVFFDLGEGGFLSYKMHPDKFDAAVDLLRDFAVTESIKVMEEQLVSEEDKLLEVGQERTALKNRQNQLADNIESMQESLAMAQRELQKTVRMQEEKNILVKKQIQRVEQIKHNLKVTQDNQ